MGIKISRADLFKSAKITFAVIIFLSFLYIGARSFDPDLGWHLKVGEWMRERGKIQTQDEYSFTMPGFRWINHEWFQDIALSWLWNKGLWPIAIIIFTLLAYVPFLVWLKRVETFAELWLIGLLSVVTLGFIGVRPQVVSFLLFFVVYELAQIGFSKSKSKIPLYPTLMPPIFLIWANLHAGFVAGLILLLVMALADLVSIWKRERKFPAPVFAAHASIILASALLTGINPHGFSIYREIVAALTSPFAGRYIVEWLPAIILFDAGSMLIIALFLLVSSGWYKKMPSVLFQPALVFGAAFIKSVRMAPLFFITLVPMLSHAYKEFIGKLIAASQEKIRGKAGARRYLDILTLSAFTLLIIYWGTALWNYQPFNFPRGAVTYLKEEARRGTQIRLLNNYGWGGYLIFEAPEIKVFIDGRMATWNNIDGRSAMRDYVDLFYKGDDARRGAIMSYWKINTVLIEPEAGTVENKWLIKLLPSGLRSAVEKSPLTKRFINHTFGDPEESFYDYLNDRGWRVAYKDDTALVLRCPGEGCIY